MFSSVRRTSRIAAVGLATAASGLVLSAPLAQPALACVPSVTGSGPTVTIAPDYSHPLQSQVGYDSSDLNVVVNTCVE